MNARARRTCHVEEIAMKRIVPLFLSLFAVVMAIGLATAIQHFLAVRAEEAAFRESEPDVLAVLNEEEVAP